jgi:hypothetical protein
MWEWTRDILIGRSTRSDWRHGLLITDREYDDFEVRLRFKIVSGCSGFYFRVKKSETNTRVIGFQAEIDTSMETGGLYETGGRKWVTKPDPALMEETYTPGEWTQMTVRAVGGDVEVRINGIITARLENDPGQGSGRLALQLHGSQSVHVEFKDLEIRMLDQGK